MESKIICFECRRHISEEEIKAGLHNHADRRDAMRELDPAASGGGED